MEAKRSFVFLNASARIDGNTALLARRAAEVLPAAHEQRWLHLRDLPLPEFEDLRHTVGSYPQPEGNERTLFDATLSATDLVFVVPLYWYSLPAEAKKYLDYWSKWLRVPGADFRKCMAGKTLWGVCVLADRDPAKAAPLVATLEIIADYLKMDFGGVLLGNGSRPGDVLNDGAAIRNAASFFQGTD